MALLGGGYIYLNSRLTGDSVHIVEAPHEDPPALLAPLPEEILILTEEEFMALMEEEWEEFDPEEMREEIERAFEPEFVEEGFISGSILDEIAALMYRDPIFEREEISDRIINVLFLGDDARIHQSRGRSDTIILISFNRDTRVIQLSSFLRDTLIPIGLHSSYWNRINSMHAIGGPGRLINLMNSLFSLDIQRYGVVRFNGVFMLVDALGGLELNLTSQEADMINRIFFDYEPLEEGLNLMDGRQVLAFSRLRAIDNDRIRSQRQRQVLTSVLNRLLDLAAPGDIFSVIAFALEHVETNIPLEELIRLGLDLFSGPRPVVQELRIPIDGSFSHGQYNGANILTMNFEQNIRALHETIYGCSEEVWIPQFASPRLDGTPIEPPPPPLAAHQEGAIQAAQ